MDRIKCVVVKSVRYFAAVDHLDVDSREGWIPTGEKNCNSKYRNSAQLLFVSI